jgi:hypothetical protein
MPELPTISILHATYHRPGGPLPVHDRWLRAASHPELIEYIVAMDDNDEPALQATRATQVLRVVRPHEQRVTAVRNWNAAASVATGSLLIVVADDLRPQQDWDAQLRSALGSLDPERVSFAVKVHDSEERGIKMLHPIVSRFFFEEHGLFDPDFRGVYCDDEITARAFWRSSIIDGRSVRFHHEHPTHERGITATESHRRVNADEEYLFGRHLYSKKWPLVLRAPLRRHGRLVNVNSTTTDLTYWMRLRPRALTLLDFAGWALRRVIQYAMTPATLARRLSIKR